MPEKHNVSINRDVLRTLIGKDISSVIFSTLEVYWPSMYSEYASLSYGSDMVLTFSGTSFESSSFDNYGYLTIRHLPIPPSSEVRYFSKSETPSFSETSSVRLWRDQYSKTVDRVTILGHIVDNILHDSCVITHFSSGEELLVDVEDSMRGRVHVTYDLDTIRSIGSQMTLISELS